MFGKIHSPRFLEPAELDDYLEKGWFRMGQDMFTCNVLHFKRVFYSAIWLRIPLDDYQYDKTFQRLLRFNAGFRVDIKPAEISIEKEALFAKYKTGIDFSTADTLAHLLLNDQGEPSIFDTYEVCVYDGKKLIATGYFDLGEKSAAGIVSFYDPDYKKHSLGKYLIYTKIAYCKGLGLKYFYPGYFAPNYPMFDYKLEIGRPVLEFFDIKTSQWYSYSRLKDLPIPIDEISRKLTSIQSVLENVGIRTARYKYEYYNANNVPRFSGMDLFDFPEFIFVLSERFTRYVPIIVFDVRDQKYRILKCVSCFYDMNYQNKEGYYGAHLLKIESELYSDLEEEPVSIFLSCQEQLMT